jgi:hypothetical protein
MAGGYSLLRTGELRYPAVAPRRHYKKLVDIPYLNAALGFFGLAEFTKGAKVLRMTDHIREFVRQESAMTSLSAFAKSLAASLNSFVPSSLRASERSGIHLGGIAPGALPEFWFVRNVDESNAPTLGKYEADEQYLLRDARRGGFDGKDPATLPSGGRLYRNGDIVSHVAAWKAIDDSLGNLLSIPFFSGIHSPQDYAAWIRFKMEVLIHFHKRFEKKLLIGGQVDVIVKT